MNQEKDAIILGALLHDVGKFIQRASENPKKQNHSLWGVEWFEDNLSEKMALIFSNEEVQIIKSAINNHHAHERFISLADAISAGLDRIKLEDEERGDPFSDRLISIFSRISISNQPKNEMYHMLASLGENSFDEAFPIDSKKCSYKEYSRLLTRFNHEISSGDFRRLSPQNGINFLYFLLWKYTWCIPSATFKDEPDISLFDHLKTTAAIAGCLYDYSKEHRSDTLNLGTNAFSLVAGDISGIQPYIFDVLTQRGKVAKRLRARSFYVQLISEIAAHKILHTFNFPLCNLITSVGGNFYILLPNLKDTNEKLWQLQREFGEWTLSQLGAELSISLAHIEASGKDLANFSEVLERLKNSLNYRKYQPHKLVLSSTKGWIEQEFLRPEVIEGDEKACQGCHKHPREEIENNEDNFCERCLIDAKIGQALTARKYLAFFDNPFSELKILNYSCELWDERNLGEELKKEPYLILAINTPDIKIPCIGFKYLATYIPTNTGFSQEATEKYGLPLTFDDIANKSQGDKLLGYVKADIDNLGQILITGFSAEKGVDSKKITKPSISRFAAFSRMLETFFSGYLEIKLEQDFKDIYTIFSGGDDFFLAGPWNETIALVQELRKEFSRFCSFNPDLTFSSGIILSKQHEPISLCAEIVEEKLKDSKMKEGKDSITLLNQTVRWDELNKILVEAKRVIGWLEKEPPIVSRALIYNLWEYGEMSRRYQKEGLIPYLKFVPLLTYDIYRNLTKESQKEALIWAENLRPSKENPQGGENLPYLRAIMDYVLTYTRS